MLLPKVQRRNVLTGSVPSATRTCWWVVCVAGSSVCPPVADRRGRCAFMEIVKIVKRRQEQGRVVSNAEQREDSERPLEQTWKSLAKL